MQADRFTRFALATLFAAVVGGIAGGTMVERINNPGEGNGTLRSADEIEAAFGGILGAGLAGSAVGFVFGRRRENAADAPATTPSKPSV